MSRTNIDIDDELVAEVMRKYNLDTKRAAVDLALRKVAGPRLTLADLNAVHGIGFEVELDDLRRDRVAEW